MHAVVRGIHDIEHCVRAVLPQAREIMLVRRVGSDRNRRLSNSLDEKVVQEVSVSHEDNAVDIPDAVRVEPEGRIGGPKRAVVLVGILQNDRTLRLPFDDLGLKATAH